MLRNSYKKTANFFSLIIAVVLVLLVQFLSSLLDLQLRLQFKENILLI